MKTPMSTENITRYIAASKSDFCGHQHKTREAAEKCAARHNRQVQHGRFADDLRREVAEVGRS